MSSIEDVAAFINENKHLFIHKQENSQRILAEANFAETKLWLLFTNLLSL